MGSDAIKRAFRWLRCVLFHFGVGSAQQATQIGVHHWKWTCCACGRTWIEADF